MILQMRWLYAVMFPAACLAVQTPDQPQPLPVQDATTELDAGRAPAAATIDRIMEQAVINIGVRYNLNEKQLEMTRELMRREVHRFIREHESEVWPIIRELLASQFKPPQNEEELKRLGRVSRRLSHLAKEAIFHANEEWRLILTPEQIQVHDFDMAEMQNTFEQINHNLSQWESGRPVDHGIFPRPRVEGEPPRPRKPPAVPAVQKVFDLNLFETLVEEFIKEYELDESQITSAHSILEEFKNKARDIRASKKEEFARVESAREAAYERADLEGIKKANAEHKKLLEPVFQLAAQMEERLKGLLTREQIERHAQKQRQAKGRPGTEDEAEPVTKKTTPTKPVPADSDADEPGSR